MSVFLYICQNSQKATREKNFHKLFVHARKREINNNIYAYNNTCYISSVIRRIFPIKYNSKYVDRDFKEDPFINGSAHVSSSSNYMK